MKVTRIQAEANRERVIGKAAKLFRERGFAAVGLNELMQAAGLTRGGFYGQFESKQDLVRLALQRALRENLALWTGVAHNAKGQPLQEFVRRYLSDAHVARTDEGCALAALGADAEREGAVAQQVFADGARQLAQLIEEMLPEQGSASRTEHAWACLSALVGALVLSRGMVGESESATVRNATIEMLLSFLGPETKERRPRKQRKATSG